MMRIKTYKYNRKTINIFIILLIEREKKLTLFTKITQIF